MTGVMKIGEIVSIRTSDIYPNPNQPRKYFDTQELTELAQSIAGCGIIQPLTVREKEVGFELVSGERRLRAAKMAGLKTVPCIIVEISDKNSALAALIENIQRKDLNCFEEAFAISKLIDRFKLTQETAAKRLGMAQSTLANKLRLLKLSHEEQELITKYNLSERHARAVLKIEDEEKRTELIKRAGERGLNVEQTEQLAAQTISAQKEKKSYQKRAAVLKDVRLFINTVNKAMSVMKLAGVNATSERLTQDDCIKVIVTIPIEGKDCSKS